MGYNERHFRQAKQRQSQIDGNIYFQTYSHIFCNSFDNQHDWKATLSIFFTTFVIMFKYLKNNSLLFPFKKKK